MIIRILLSLVIASCPALGFCFGATVHFSHSHAEISDSIITIKSAGKTTVFTKYGRFVRVTCEGGCIPSNFVTGDIVIDAKGSPCSSPSELMQLASSSLEENDELRVKVHRLGGFFDLIISNEDLPVLADAIQPAY